MKMRIMTVFAAITIAISLPLNAVSDMNSSNLTIVISNVRKHMGTLRIALMNSKDNFDHVINANGRKDAEFLPYKGKIVSANAKSTTTVTFNDVPNGEYSFVVMHDLNLNEKLDMGLFGPTEPYIFSNNKKGSFGPPSFDDTKVSVTSTQNSFSVSL